MSTVLSTPLIRLSSICTTAFKSLKSGRRAPCRRPANNRCTLVWRFFFARRTSPLARAKRGDYALRMRVLTFILSILLASAVQAEQPIYRSQDAAGRPVYSDQPTSGEPVVLAPLNTAARPLAPAARSPRAASTAVVRRHLTITAPASGSTVGHAVAGVLVQAQVYGALATGEHYQCLHNGQPVAPLRSDNSCWVALPERGEQRLQVALLDAAGRTLMVSDPVVVFVQRHHLPALPTTP